MVGKDLSLSVLLKCEDMLSGKIKIAGKSFAEWEKTAQRLAKTLSGLNTENLNVAASSLKAADDAGKLAGQLDNSSNKVKDVQETAKKATDTFRSMSGSMRGDKIITGDEVARAKIILLESNANELRTKLASLEHAADAGKAVDGIEEMRAQITLAEKKAQDARDSLKKLEKQADNVGTAADRFSKRQQAAFSTIKSAAQGMAAVVGPILLNVAQDLVGVAEHSVQSAVDFQQAMVSVGANAGATQKDIDSATDAILHMAGEVGQAPKQLADGLYYVAGAGYNVRDALTILEASSKTAQVGLTDTQVVANGLTAVLKALGLNANQTTRIMNEMQQSVSLGKTEWSDYSKIIGNLASKSKNAKVSFEETTAAFSILTNIMPNSKQAAASLSSLLNTSSKFDLLSKRAKDLGLSFDETKYKNMSLLDRMKYLQTITGGNAEEIGKLLGQQNAQVAMTALLTGNAKDYTDALDKVKHASDGAGAAQDAWNKTQKSTKQQWDQAKSSLDALGIELGSALLPILNNLLKTVGPVIQKAVDWESKNHGLENSIKFVVNIVKTLVGWGQAVVKFFQDNQWATVALISVLITIAALILSIVIPAFIAWAIAMVPVVIEALLLAAPFILIGLIIAAVIFGIIMAILHWNDIMKWFGGVFGAIGKWIGDRMSDLGSTVHNVISRIGDFFSWLGTKVHGVWDGIVSGIKSAINSIIDVINGFIGFIDSIQIHIPAIGVGPIHTPAFDWNGLGIPKIPHLKAGGTIDYAGRVLVGDDGPEYLDLPVGARVIPLSRAGGYPAPGSAPLQGGLVLNFGDIVINAGPGTDGRQLAKDFVDAIYPMIMQKMDRDFKRSHNNQRFTSGGKAAT